MKKFLIVVIVIIVCGILSYNFWLKKYNPTIYQTSLEQEKVSDAGIIVDNLKITLKGFYSSKATPEQISALSIDEEAKNTINKYLENSNYSFLIEFSTIEFVESKILEPDFDFIVYDNSGNVIMTSMIYRKGYTKTNKFLKYFMQKEQNSNNIYEFGEHILQNGYSRQVVDNSGNSNLILVYSNIDKNRYDELDTSKIHVSIVNPSYRTDKGSKKYNLDNTIWEFIVEK